MTTNSISLSLIFDKGFWKELNVILPPYKLDTKCFESVVSKGCVDYAMIGLE